MDQNMGSPAAAKISMYKSNAMTVGDFLNVIGDMNMIFVIANANSPDDQLTEIVYRGSVASFADLPHIIGNVLATLPVDHFMIGFEDGSPYLSINVSFKDTPEAPKPSSGYSNIPTNRAIVDIIAEGNSDDQRVVKRFLNILMDVMTNSENITIHNSPSEYYEKYLSGVDDGAFIDAKRGAMFVRGFVIEEAARKCGYTKPQMGRILYDTKTIVVGSLSRGFTCQHSGSGNMVFYQIPLHFLGIDIPEERDIKKPSRAPILPDANFYVPFMQWVISEGLTTVSVNAIKQKFRVGIDKANRILKVFVDLGVVVKNSGRYHSVDIAKCKEQLLNYKRGSSIEASSFTDNKEG